MPDYLEQFVGHENMMLLEKPQFLHYLEARYPQMILPDMQDINVAAPEPHTEAEATYQFRAAQARKILRLFREWENAPDCGAKGGSSASKAQSNGSGSPTSSVLPPCLDPPPFRAGCVAGQRLN